MTRRNLFGAVAGMLGAAVVGKLPAKAALPVATAPEELPLTYTNILAETACAPPLTMERLEASIQAWKAEMLQATKESEAMRLDRLASRYGIVWDDTEQGWHYVNE